MIRFQAFGTECRLHVLAILFGALGFALGMGAEMPHLMAAMFVHESAHLISAKLCGLSIDYIELMPFGGAAHISDLYSSNKAALAITASAGPLANMLFATFAAALAWWDVLGMRQAAIIIRINMMLMLFNLMPALPLDGGRIFYALLSTRLNERTALKICAILGYTLAGILFSLCILNCISAGVINITLIISAVFLIASTIKEQHQYSDAAAPAVASLMSYYELPAKAQLVVFPEDMDPALALKYMRHGETVFAMAADGAIKTFVTAEEMARRVLRR